VVSEFLFFYCHGTVHESSQGIVTNAHRFLYSVVMIDQPEKKQSALGRQENEGVFHKKRKGQ
jgi:hypothetical protein